MIKMSEINSLDKLKALFPNKNLEKCSVGLPVKDGISLGYEGWGSPDIILDPALPLDMCVDRLGLKSAFKSVISIGLLNCVHGDCILTHTTVGLEKLLAEGGTLSIEVLNTSALAKTALENLDNCNITKCQMLEKFIFQPVLDISGLVFQQTFQQVLQH